jgi:arylsulfatase A-like enzyme
VKPGRSGALISQVDFLATLAALTGQDAAVDTAPDSHNLMPALLGESPEGREYLVEHAGALALREGAWKLIAPGQGAKFNRNTSTELGNDPQPQLYHLGDDPGETRNLAGEWPDRTREMMKTLEETAERRRREPIVGR